MKKLKVTEEYRAYSEEEAMKAIAAARELQREGGYTLGANGYKYKTKKSKGEICAEGWLVSLTKIYNDFWDDGGDTPNG